MQRYQLLSTAKSRYAARVIGMVCGSFSGQSRPLAETLLSTKAGLGLYRRPTPQNVFNAVRIAQRQEIRQRCNRIERRKRILISQITVCECRTREKTQP